MSPSSLPAFHRSSQQALTATPSHSEQSPLQVSAEQISAELKMERCLIGAVPKERDLAAILQALSRVLKGYSFRHSYNSYNRVIAEEMLAEVMRGELPSIESVSAGLSTGSYNFGGDIGHHQQYLRGCVEDASHTNVVEQAHFMVPIAPKSRFPLRSLDAIEADARTSELIEGVIPCGSTFGLVGPPGVGKSLIALHWGVCVATGHTWNGRQVGRGPVVVITPEGVSGLAKRVRGCCAAYDITRPQNLFFITATPQFMQAGDVADLITEIATLGEKPFLFVIDTLARHMIGGDENSTRDAGLFMAGVERLRATFEATALLVHHTGKDGKPRGATALVAAMDGAAEIKAVADKSEKRVILQCVKGARDNAPFASINLTGRVVELPGGDTSLVFDEDAGHTAPTSTLSDKEVRSLAVLRSHPDGLTISAWVSESGLQERTLYRCRDALLKAGMVVKPTERGGKYIAAPLPTHLEELTSTDKALP